MEDETEKQKQKKHSAMLERLSKRGQTRSTNPESSAESTSSFFSRFSTLKTSIESQLDQSQSFSSDPTNLKLHFQSISQSISDLEKLVAENSYLLPSYDVRTSLKTVSDLKNSLENLTNQLIPKRKFSFKNKPTKKDDKDTAIPQPKQPSQLSTLDTRLAVRESPGFRNKVGEVLVARFRGSEVGEFAVSDLDSCEVRILGSVRALFVHRLKNSRVSVGPVTGSVLIEEAEGCVFVLASHQIRIHAARKCDFYLRVRSRPIIEDCNGVRFAPYCLSYRGIEEDLRGAGLDTETGNWENVDDFRWLRAVQSPNWLVLPESERVGIVDLSNLKNGDEEI
ncbi:unnamed protein product [Sphenostylis stenocarpa]|uniref:C-CAP/cofactor C-like domain-containing protein n=1 Tax=Sphenostylis stenocarpa TaxID=92480 RepID=A0AA86SE17_9FABA|nr:unnamed protein product [Sphenostylis stenocarpa]